MGKRDDVIEADAISTAAVSRRMFGTPCCCPGLADVTMSRRSCQTILIKSGDQAIGGRLIGHATAP